MSHIDEGELTAYADGAYPPADADGQRIAMHLAECANCRNRLAQAQTLSGRASEILAVATPASMDAPPFEQIAANVTPRKRTRGVPLSWAASIVLAAGLGWFGRDALYEPDAGLKMTASPESRSDRAAEARSPEPQIAPAESPTPGVATAPAGPREVSPTRGQVGSGARGDTRGGSVATANEAVQDAVEEPLAAVAAPAPSGQTRQVEERAEAGAALGRVAAPPPPQLAPQPEAKSLRMERQNTAAGDLAAGGSIQYITAAEAEKRKLVLHIVPELEIVRIGLTDTGVTVEQKLPDGKIVTLTSTSERPAVARESDATARKSVAGARAQAATAPVVVTRGAIRVTISGSLPGDSLRALGAKVR